MVGFLIWPMLAAAGVANVPWQRPFQEVAALDGRAADERVAYGESAQQFAELWLPPEAAGPAPVVVLIHGGCWLAAYDLAHIRPLAAALADSGFAVWAVEYRRLGNDGGGWPGTFHDIADAVDFLAAWRHPRLDPRKMVLAGHSAGGHLALWAAGRSRLAEDRELYRPAAAPVRGAVGLAAITDLAAYAEGENSCQQALPKLMGGQAGDRPERYAQASPSVLGSDVPTVLIQGDADTIVPPGQARRAPGAKPVMLNGAGHFDLIHPGTAAFPALLSALEELTAP